MLIFPSFTSLRGKRSPGNPGVERSGTARAPGPANTKKEMRAQRRNLDWCERERERERDRERDRERQRETERERKSRMRTG